jgi:hypothetical protein
MSSVSYVVWRFFFFGTIGCWIWHLFVSEMGGIGLGGLGMRLLAGIYYGRVLILYFMV